MIGDPAKSIRNAVLVAKNIARDEGALSANGIRAYHGSPYDFNAFDASKIGTGEGAQAYGHGLYFADNQDVARAYRDNLLSRAGEPQNMRVGKTDLQDIYSRIERGAAAMPAKAAGPEYDKLGALEALMQHGDMPGAREAFKAGQIQPEAMAWLEKEVAPKFTRNGKMYEVNINAEPHQFLDWDKPLSEQPQIMGRLDPAMKAHAERIMERPVNTLDGKGLVRSSNGFNGDDASGVSNALRDAGIPGIKYLDQGSRSSVNVNDIRGSLGMWQKALSKTPDDPYAQSQVQSLTKQLADAEKPLTSNYVVFDPRIVDIVKKFGLGGGAGAGDGKWWDAAQDISYTHPIRKAVGGAMTMPIMDHDVMHRKDADDIAPINNTGNILSIINKALHLTSRTGSSLPEAVHLARQLTRGRP